MADYDFDASRARIGGSRWACVDNRETCSSNRNHTILERAVEKVDAKVPPVTSVTKAV